MTTTERQRLDLHHRLDEALGPDHAATLMDSLSPIPWTELATKEDLADLRAELDLRFDRVDLRFEQIDGRFEVEMALLRGELAEFRATLSADLMRQLVVIHAATVALIVGLLYGGSALLG